MVETVQSHEGYVTMEDMTEYQVTSPEPASTLYQRYHVLTSGGEWGGAELVEKLNLMELAGIGSSSDPYLTNATKLFWLASITRLSSFMSFFTHAVPDGKQLLKEHLGVDADNSYRKTKDAAEELWDKIASPEKMRDVNEIMREMLASVEMGMEQHLHSSSGVVAVDSAGNVCSLVHGTNSGIWGTGLFVQGVSLPGAGIALKSLITETKSGKRVPSGLQPVIIFKDEPREFDGFGRRFRRAISIAKKNKKRLSVNKKGFSNHGYPRIEVPKKLVVLRTQNRVRSELIHESQANTLEQEKPNGHRQQEHWKKPAELAEEEHPDVIHCNFSAGELTFSRRTQKRERTETLQEAKSTKKVSIHGEQSSPSTEELDEFEELPTEEEHLEINTIPSDEKQESEEEENGFEEETIETEEPTEGEERQKEKAIDRDEFKEFPHLGIPDAWKSDTMMDEVDDTILRAGLVPILALACNGPSHPLVIPQYLTNILDSGMNPKAALEAPTFLAPSPHSFQQDIQVEKYTIDENVLQDVNEFGQQLTEVDPETAEEVAGTGVAVTLDSDRKMLGCAHPSDGGLAEGLKVLDD